MDEIRYKHWRDIAEEVYNKNKMHALMWQIYAKQKQYLIKRSFLVSVPHPKGVDVVCTCVNDHIIDEMEKCETIRLHRFYYNFFEEEQGGGTRELLYRYPYFNHIVQLCSGDWVIQMEQNN